MIQKTRVGRVYHFRAVHSLPESFGRPWCFLHEHDYTVEVEAQGGTDTDNLDGWWGAIGEILENENLNDHFKPSTVERIAEQLLEQGPLLLSVTIWEDRARWGRAER